MLDENYQLIQAIQDQQSKPGGGKPADCVQYQQVLHRNLVYLATLADSGNSNLGSLLPAPGKPKGKRTCTGSSITIDLF